MQLAVLRPLALLCKTANHNCSQAKTSLGFQITLEGLHTGLSIAKISQTLDCSDKKGGSSDSFETL